ncbi:MAG: DUF3253 domain-containing protein [Rhodoglobus sp.]
MAHRRREPNDSDAKDKTCVSCGRRIQWRATWARDWNSVRYCSTACRNHKVTAIDLQLEESIAVLLSARARDATICPSEAARAVDGARCRELMEPARRAARRMVARGELQITQGGLVVAPSTAKGPIRLRRPR